jgi:acetyl-CoA synthetase
MSSSSSSSSSTLLPPSNDPPNIYSPLPVKGKSLKEGWEEYNKRYKESIENTDEYWSKEANKYITWLTPFKRVSNGTFLEGDVNWFAEGKLNACYNCVDRHLEKKADQTAIIWEADEPGQESKHISYAELSKEISRIANVMIMMGVKKGDVVTIYMPMIPELMMVMLACARIGAVHSVVFAGFSADSLRGRILDCDSK